MGRFIPASAGNTFSSASEGGFLSVHPRERGEHIDKQRHGSTSSGSSPRARGTHTLDLGVAVRPRFIPASAGNTPPCARN